MYPNVTGIRWIAAQISCMLNDAIWIVCVCVLPFYSQPTKFAFRGIRFQLEPETECERTGRLTYNMKYLHTQLSSSSFIPVELFDKIGNVCIVIYSIRYALIFYHLICMKTFWITKSLKLWNNLLFGRKLIYWCILCNSDMSILQNRNDILNFNLRSVTKSDSFYWFHESVAFWFQPA